MNAFQMTGKILKVAKKHDSVLLTLLYDNTSKTQNSMASVKQAENTEKGLAKLKTQPMFIGRAEVRVRGGSLQALSRNYDAQVIDKGKIVEIEGFIQGVMKLGVGGKPVLSAELVATRVVPIQVDKDLNKYGEPV